MGNRRACSLHGAPEPRVVLHASQRIQQLPVPCELRGVVTMELEFAQGAVLRLRCDSLSLHPVQGVVTAAYQC